MNPTTVYAGTASGVFRSLNSGGFWANTGSLFEDDILCLLVDTGIPDRIFIGTDDGGVFGSLDGGAGWTAHTSGMTAVTIHDLVHDPKLPSTVYAATAGGFRRSLDRGVTWTLRSGSLPDGPLYDIEPLPDQPSRLYAGTSEGVYRTIDGGNTWIAMNVGIPPSTAIGALAVAPSQSTVVYAGAVTGEVYRSADQGVSWSDVTSDLPGHRVTALVVDPIDAQTCYAATWGAGVYKTVTARRGLVSPERRHG